MKKSTLALTACAVSAFCLAFIFGAQADTATPAPITPTTAAPAAPKAPIAPESPTAPGVDARVIIRPGDPAGTPTVIPVDPDQRKNEANFRAAVEKCNAIVSPDSKKQCMADAEANFTDGNP